MTLSKRLAKVTAASSIAIVGIATVDIASNTPNCNGMDLGLGFMKTVN